MATTSASPVSGSPSVIVTVRAAGSTAATSASLTSTFGLSRNSLRIWNAMSLGASWEVATW